MSELATLPAMQTFKISSVSKKMEAELQQKIDGKTKPLGALGQIELVAKRLGLIQQTVSPTLSKPTIVLFAGDHGLVSEGVSPYPQEVTFQMVYNFLAGGAAINVFARQNGLRVVVVDAGVNHDFPAEAALVRAKIGYGTANMLQRAAMTAVQRDDAVAAGAKVVREVADSGCNIIGFGEMGIGNTSSAALLMSLLCGLPLVDCVGRGTGLDDAGVQRKTAVLEQVLALHQPTLGNTPDPLAALAAVGGFEIAQMVGGMLQAAEDRIAIMVDGFIATAAFLVAAALHPTIKDYAIFAHQSNEQGHKRMLDFLGGTPLLSLGMRLGEGSGVAVAYPLLETAVRFLDEMASFADAGVSNKS